MGRVIEQAIGDEEFELTEEEIALEEFDELSQELRELIDQHEAVDNALQVVRANRQHLQYAQENNVSLESSERFMWLSLEAALGGDEYLPETLDEASLCSLETRLEVSFENIFEAMGHKIASIWNTLRKNAEKFESKRKELYKRLEKLDDTDEGSDVKLTKGRARMLTTTSTVNTRKLASQIESTNEEIKTFSSSLYNYSYRLYAQIGDGQKQLERISDEDDDTKAKVLKEQWDEVSDIIRAHTSDMSRKAGEQLLGKWRITNNTIMSEYIAKLEDGSWTNLPQVTIIKTESHKIKSKEVSVPEKEELKEILEAIKGTIDLIYDAQSHIAKIEKTMSKAAKKADSIKVRRLKLPEPGQRVDHYLLTFAFLYFGNGFKRQMRQTMDNFRELINYKVDLTRATLNLAEKCIKTSEKN